MTIKSGRNIRTLDGRFSILCALKVSSLLFFHYARNSNTCFSRKIPEQFDLLYHSLVVGIDRSAVHQFLLLCNLVSISLTGKLEARSN